MAEKKTATTEDSTAVVGEIEPKFRLDRIKKDCRKLFGVSSTAFAGATAELADGEYTISEVRSIIDTWCKKEAK